LFLTGLQGHPVGLRKKRIPCCQRISQHLSCTNFTTGMLEEMCQIKAKCWDVRSAIKGLESFRLCRVFTELRLFFWELQNLQLNLSVFFYVYGSVPRKYIPIHIQQDAALHSLFISGNCSTCFGWYLHPSSEAHVTIYSIWYLSLRYCYLPPVVKSLQMASLGLKHVAAIVAFETNSCLRLVIIDNIQQGCTFPGREVAAWRLHFFKVAPRTWRRRLDFWIIYVSLA